MLPFLNKKNSPGNSSVIVKQRTPDEKPEENQDDSSTAREACAKDLLRAIKADDVKGIADALYDAFSIMENEPNNEVEPHSYEAQNEKAGDE